MRWLAEHPLDDKHLRDQATRAGQSIVLNIAEDQGRAGRSRTYHFRIALGSAAELCAALNLVARDTTEEQNKLRRVGMMLRIIGAVGEAHRSAG